MNWTPELEAHLVKLYRIGWSASRIARRLGLTRNQVAGKTTRLGLRGTMQEWEAREVDTLKRMISQGYSFAEIAAALVNRSRSACIGKADRLGLGGNDRATQCRRGYHRTKPTDSHEGDAP